MLRLAKTGGWIAALLLLGFQSAFGFSIGGPINESFQTRDRGYAVGGDILAPKNLGEEYRWNTPVLYYAFDSSFLDYFGSNGVYAVEQAIAILNNLTNVSSFSADLSEYPLEAGRFNFKAQTLQLVDLKSEALHLLIEEFGLAEPDRWTWTLHNRFLPPGAQCPAFEYTVIKRNFDPITWEPSSYVNNTLYTYFILELCPPPGPNEADATEVRVDPTQPGFTAVASLGNLVSFLDGAEFDEGAIRYGFFNTSLTRDDVGGLRYLLGTNNMNFESAEPNSLEFVTNVTSQLLASSNLALLGAQALTNNAATLAALFPGLVIIDSTNTFEVVLVTNLIPVFTTPPWAPAGNFVLTFITNITPTAQIIFHHTFGNLVTFQFINGQWVAVQTPNIEPLVTHNFVSVQTAVITNAPWAPAGTVLVTNTFNRMFITNTVGGEFFILPANACDVKIFAPILTNIVQVTNNITATNNLGQTNVNGQFFSQNVITFFTNHTFVVSLVNCVTSSPALLQGIEKISFVRSDFDSLLGQFYNPITNTYHITEVTNGRPIVRTYQRVLTRPDVLFSAADLALSGGPPLIHNIASRTAFAGGHVVLDQQIVVPGLPNPRPGPGTILPPMDITFDKVGPFYINLGPNFIDEATGVIDFIWGSFDGTTNDPIVYPQGTSIRDLENQVIMQITTTSLTSAAVGVDYSAQLQANGGTLPYTWSLAPSSPNLAAGLSLTSSGLISGTPGQAGTFDFIVRLTDAAGRISDRPLTIIITP